MALGDRKDGVMPGNNMENSLALIQLGMCVDGELYHDPSVPAKDVLLDSIVGPRFLAVGGVYKANPPTYTDGQAVTFHFTSAGAVKTDATFSGTIVSQSTIWTKRFFKRVSLTDTGVHLTFTGFDPTLPMEVIVANDDTHNVVYFDYAGMPTVTSPGSDSFDQITAGESFTDNFGATGIYLSTASGLTASIRVWARQ